MTITVDIFWVLWNLNPEHTVQLSQYEGLFSPYGWASTASTLSPPPPSLETCSKFRLLEHTEDIKNSKIHPLPLLFSSKCLGKNLKYPDGLRAVLFRFWLIQAYASMASFLLSWIANIQLGSLRLSTWFRDYIEPLKYTYGRGKKKKKDSILSVVQILQAFNQIRRKDIYEKSSEWLFILFITYGLIIYSKLLIAEYPYLALKNISDTPKGY